MTKALCKNVQLLPDLNSILTRCCCMQGDPLADRPPMQLIHYSQLLCHFDLQHQALKHSCLFITTLNNTKKATASLIVALQAVTSHDTVSTL